MVAVQAAIDANKQYERDQVELSAYEDVTSNSFTADYDGFITIFGITEARNATGALCANGITIAQVYRDASVSAMGAIKKGDAITFSGWDWMGTPKAVWYKKRDYSGRT